MSWDFEHIEDHIVHLIVNKREFAVDVLHELDPNLFQDDTCRILISIIKAYFQQYSAVPKLAQVKTLVSKNKIKKFEDLEAERIYDGIKLEPSEIEFVFDQIPKFIKLNKFKELLINASIDASKTDSFDKQEEIFENFESQFKDIMRFNVDRDLGLRVREDYKKRYAILKSRRDKGVQPALNGLAKYTGGYFPKELYAYVGAASVGKSIMLACDAFAAMQQGFNVVLISMEMSEELFGLRMDQQAVRKASKELLHTDTAMIYQMLEERYVKTANNAGWGEIYTKEFPTGEASVHTIERYLEMLLIYENFKADFVVVDYGDIMRPNGRSTGNRYDDQGKVFQELRAFAKEYEIPVLTAMQTNRPQRDGRGNPVRGPITEERIADCFDKIRTLDGCYSINVDTGPAGDEEEMENQMSRLDASMILNEFYLFLIKNRHGKKEVKVPYIMNKMYMEIRDRDKDSDEED